MRQREKPNPSDQISRQKEFEFGPPLRWPLTHSPSRKWRLKNKVSAVRPCDEPFPWTLLLSPPSPPSPPWRQKRTRCSLKRTWTQNPLFAPTVWTTAPADLLIKNIDSIITSWNIIKCTCTSQLPESETAPGRGFIPSFPVDVCVDV